jgi:hypothetical protein
MIGKSHFVVGCPNAEKTNLNVFSNVEHKVIAVTQFVVLSLSCFVDNRLGKPD